MSESPVANAPAAPLTWQWHYHRFKAMNTEVYLKLYTAVAADNILQDVQYAFANIEKSLSRFNPASELSQLNAWGTKPFTASSTLFSVLEVALWAASVTAGLYDPTILNYLEQAGYKHSFETIPQPAPFQFNPLPATAPVSAKVQQPFNFQSVQLNRARQTIYKPAEVRLDLGGIGKGWTVDRTAERLQGLGPFLVNAGGDIFAFQTPPGEKGWKIDLVHPYSPDLFMGQILINHQALATSTLSKRRWYNNGQIQHHLIDPRTGRPAQTDALSVTVIANRTTLAEIYAKVALILGVEQGLAYLQQLPDVQGLIFTAQSEIKFTAGFEALFTRLNPKGYKLQDS